MVLPVGCAGIAIPFYLPIPADEAREENDARVEGSTWSECMAILRHETGHAIQHAYQFCNAAGLATVVRSVFETLPALLPPNPALGAMSRLTSRWYAQSHPDEDFAETFAVWLPAAVELAHALCRFWPALKKLEYVDELMGEIQAAAAVLTRERVDPLSTLSQTLGGALPEKQAFYEFTPPKTYDRDLIRLFSDDPGIDGRSRVALHPAAPRANQAADSRDGPARTS